MASVTVELPSVLLGVIDVDGRVDLEAGSLRQALDRLVERLPALSVHLFDETGGFRQHVLCFHNDTNTRWLDSLDVLLADGDRITILQAVSGG